MGSALGIPEGTKVPARLSLHADARGTPAGDALLALSSLLSLGSLFHSHGSTLNRCGLATDLRIWRATWRPYQWGAGRKQTPIQLVQVQER